MKTEEKSPIVEPAELEWFERMVREQTPIDPENVPRLVHTVRQLWEAIAVLADERPRFVGGLPDQDPIPPLGDCCMHDRRYGPTDLKGVTVTIEAVDPEAFKKKIGEISGRGAIAKALGLPRVESKTLEVAEETYSAAPLWQHPDGDG